MRTVTSELLRVPGVGPVKRRRLLEAFGSIQGVRDAGVDAIAGVRGFNADSARALLAALGVPVDVPLDPPAAASPQGAGNATGPAASSAVAAESPPDA
jgi:excinuclease ABC subunit C